MVNPFPKNQRTAHSAQRTAHSAQRTAHISDNSAQKNFFSSASQGVFCARANLQHKKKSSILWGFRPVFAVLASIFLLVSCDPPKSSPPKLQFSQSEVFKSKNIYAVRGRGTTAQKYTNKLTYGTANVTARATYQITDPANFTSKNISINASTGELTFEDKLATVTVEATHAGKKATYRFTVTDHFPVRSGHQTVMLGSEIYLIGGSTDSGDLNDVWKSTDGESWIRVLANNTNRNSTTQFSRRNGHQSVALKNEIYVIGGIEGTPPAFNDVWKSTNGQSWTRVQNNGATSTFSARSDHSSVVLNNEIYVIGGAGSNEVWKSANGATWTPVLANNTSPPATQFSGRGGHSSVVINSGTHAGIYVIGGFAGSNRVNDVWKSTNGQSWTRVQNNGAASTFSARNGHSSVVLNNEIYVIGGFNGTNRFNDVWKSKDGKDWTKAQNNGATSTFSARNNHSSFVIGNAIYVVGGLGPGNSEFNDIWKSTNGGVTWVNVHE